jgi:AraC family transcriptional regulator
MDPVARALWFIESHSGQELSLDDIAAACGVSRFHLSHAFGQTLGRSVMRYLRGRRLSEAARALAAGAPDILSVALEAGYGSHEAFTRAFREQFGITPEAVRAEGCINGMELMEPILMDANLNTSLEAPRMVEGRAMLIAGLGQRFEYENLDGIPALWQRFVPHIGNIAGEVPGVAYGVMAHGDATGLDYICGVEVTDFSEIDRSFTRIRVAPQRYAVFVHRDHVSSIRGTMQAIWREWLPRSGLEMADAPGFERYGPEFDARTGAGGLEVWIPVKG